MLLVILKIFLFIVEALIILAIIIYSYITIFPPRIKNKKQANHPRIKIGENSYNCGKGWIRKNRNNLMEMYIEGDAYERGVITGKLTKELFNYQEEIFVFDLKKKVPSGIKRYLLKLAIGIFNRRISQHIGKEFSTEIYGVSKSASLKYYFIAPAFIRIMNYHAAHDIGHTLQDMKYVGCTAISLKGEYTKNKKLLIGRNFDFHINEEFSRDKIVAFYKPAKGHAFAMVSWAGMIGVTSGMNMRGITITINGAKSAIPRKTATPVSIIAREILQYAGNLKEAEEIARNRKMFVSELLMVSSAEENKSIIIEKTPLKTDVFETDSEAVICTNHFQGKVFKDDPLNISNIEDSSTMYRYNLVKELIEKGKPFDPVEMAKMLREKRGRNNSDIGLGNEKAINQLIAHHSVIFNPHELIMYVSSPPYNIGEYMAYDLNEVFAMAANGCPVKEIDNQKLKIDADEFLFSGKFKEYEKYKHMLETLINSTINKNEEQDFFNEICLRNPEFYLSYSSIGDYLKNKKRYKDASEWYSKALLKEFHHKAEFKIVQKNHDDCLLKLKL
ncbi:MAG: hypothetical protein HY951_01630 [Bacteroidia bacterium]|nr:hypothetical protein [Bacteroidia bacterium]